MRKILMFPILLVLILFVAVQTAYSASLPTLTYYEAANQFTTNSNPNGTWTYGYTTKLGGSFTRYTISGNSAVGDGWYGYTLGNTPLLVSQSGLPVTQLLTFHPGPNDEQSVARWIAPSSGTFNFLGFFYGLDPADGSTVNVLKNNVAVYADIVSAYGEEKDFSLSFSLRKGDKIDFVVATIPGHAIGGAYAGMGVAIAPQLFNFTPVQYPGVPNTIVYGMNNLGDIVGRYRGTDDVRHGFMRRNGVFTTIDYPGADYNFLININDWGQVVGITWDANITVSKSFLWSNGKFTDLMPPGGVDAQAQDINDFGYIVGYYDTGGLTFDRTFVRRPDGSYFSFEVPGSLPLTTGAAGINLLGQISGWYADEAFNYHGYVRNPNGKFTTTDFPGAVNGTFLSYINVWGATDGVYYGLGGPADGQSFVSVGSNFVPVWLPGTDYIYTYLALGKINDLGQVVAYYLDADNVGHSFIGTPILPLR
jgi:probable HAF family extracellular repeat protein